MPTETRKMSKSILTLIRNMEKEMQKECMDTIEHLIRFMGKPTEDVLNELLERMRDEEKMVYTSRIPMGRVRKLAEYAGVNNDGKL